ncbi:MULTISPECIES: serine hydrolase domain-containing protein [Hyphobacterium]|uniref:Serine hydrolase domain-containing protein n=1 Tax=Hyphobacterium vulgare TaxID=1736751 RepID=A0ABV6ZY13_9PROT
MLRTLTAVSLFALAPAALAQDIPSATERMEAYLDQFSGVVGPGFAVIVVTADDVLIERVEGLRNAETGAPLTPDTPIYIASQTKAYVGLLAAVLDERGILPLDTPLDTFWPDAQWPGNMAPGDFTLRDLLTHQVPFENVTITFMEAYVMRVDPVDYPELISAYSEPRDPGFRYDNLGYNVYAAILETVTGRPWQEWLDEVIFDPLGMDRTSARTSDFMLDELSWSHIWQGEEDGWFEIRPKTDGMMQSAGGLVTSPGDMIAWLQLQLRGEAPEAGLTASMLETANTSFAETGMGSQNPYEMECDGYALGWAVCSFEGFEIHIHGGGYTGARSIMAWSPDAGVGIAAFGNSDNMTGWWTQTAVRMFLQFLADHPDADRMVEARLQFYHERTAAHLQFQQQSLAEALAGESWGGWTWQPDASELAVYAGRYVSERLPVTAEFVPSGSGLEFRFGDMRSNLRPARPGLFGGTATPFDQPDAFEFTLGEDGRPTGFIWNDEVFTRSAG